MKIESRWHINRRVLQGHADKGRLLLLTGHFHDWVTGPTQKDSGGVDSRTQINSNVDQPSEAVAVQLTSSGAHPERKHECVALLSLGSFGMRPRRQRIPAAPDKEKAATGPRAEGAKIHRPWRLLFRKTGESPAYKYTFTSLYSQGSCM